MTGDAKQVRATSLAPMSARTQRRRRLELDQQRPCPQSLFSAGAPGPANSYVCFPLLE